jgi:hypothetical protein
MIVACINKGVLQRPEDNSPASLNSKRQRMPKGRRGRLGKKATPGRYSK